jgi:hypothetical protein
MKTWRELEAEGVKRCCVTFTNGKRCSHRAVEEFDFSWCHKHGPIMKMHTDHANAALQKNGEV